MSTTDANGKNITCQQLRQLIGKLRLRRFQCIPLATHITRVPQRNSIFRHRDIRQKASHLRWRKARTNAPVIALHARVTRKAEQRHAAMAVLIQQHHALMPARAEFTFERIHAPLPH